MIGPSAASRPAVALIIRDQWYLSHPILQGDPNVSLENLFSTLIIWLIGPTVGWILLALVLANDWAGRPAEHWLRVWLRYRRFPAVLETPAAVRRHHVQLTLGESCVEDSDGTARGVVEVTTLNLRMTDEATLSGHIKKLHAFYVALRFPIQIVVRAWQTPDGMITRRWFIAIMAPNQALLRERQRDIVAGLKRAGLNGRALNGDLFDTLQQCWSVSASRTELGPKVLKRQRDHAVVDGEYVRGMVLGKFRAWWMPTG